MSDNLLMLLEMIEKVLEEQSKHSEADEIIAIIKANFPARIAFQVATKIDSRTILDQGGAEQLLGYGDMLYLPPGVGVPVRVHGAFVGDDEVHRVVNDWKSRAEPNYVEEIIDAIGGNLYHRNDICNENILSIYEESGVNIEEGNKVVEKIINSLV